ncbi:fungal-specific transcription factor domain-containing protein [Aspergillus minisclerotigenes]|uniref:Fungal-specific transcription factor domain-containing protein n=1 Tax=Aspergillus minisclerotigenes TaxID=656917 RepID=A0A5N6IPC4_9EURO|nr:fungal-specific transcription factor domain-containing protein [Aspergillus minisclerotigenes]
MASDGLPTMTAATASRGTKASSAVSKTRPRSLGGCATCRSRHVKCDESRPSCLVCRNLGLTCDKYEIRLVFDAIDTQGSRCRRPLFTEDMRQRMSKELVDSVNPDDAATLLLQIDDQCEEQEQHPDSYFDTYLGPFGAFRAPRPELEPTDGLTCPSIKPPPYQHVPIADDFDTAFEDALINDPLMECLFGGIDVNATGDFQTESFFNITGTENHERSSQQSVTESSEMLMGLPSLSQHIQYTPTIPNLAPADAPFLLSVYKSQVVTLFSPVHSIKAPWHILHVPSAMGTFAQLTMGEQPGNAQLCIFYAILATGAYMQRAISTSQGHREYWQRQSESYAVSAQNYLKVALQDMSATLKKSKYKDILIALMCMNTVFAYQGNEDRIRRCLLDCENWIRFRGIPKTRKSRKVRLLHHCYVYLRIFYESTSVSHVRGSSMQQEMNESPDTITSVASSPSFRLRQWEGRLDQRMNELKEQHLGENDIHLEIPGRWDSTMYPHVFGMPETLLFLLSQVTRLGNERDMSDLDGGSSILDFRQFSSRARSLERYICTWRPSSSPFHGEDNEDDDLNGNGAFKANTILSSHMVLALHKALLVFFYRRIYDVDPTILQDRVWQVQDSLSRCDRGDIPTAPLLWAAFVAACEALDPTLRDWFTNWFNRSFKASGLQNFKFALNIAKQVWEKQGRSLSSDNSTSWPQVMRDSGMSMFYV